MVKRIMLQELFIYIEIFKTAKKIEEQNKCVNEKDTYRIYDDCGINHVPSTYVSI